VTCFGGHEADSGLEVAGSQPHHVIVLSIRKGNADYVYCSPSQKGVGIFCFVFFTLAFLDEVIRWGGNTFVLVLGIGGGIVNAFVCLRLAFARIESSEHGIHVANVFTGVNLTWKQIDRFSIGRWALLPYVCLIHLRDGTVQHATGIEENTSFANGSAEEIVEELNDELARRLPERSSQSSVVSGSVSAQSELFGQPRR
jgi:hypothetical protein